MDGPGNLDPAWMVHAKIAFAALCGGIVRLLFKPASSFLKTVWLLFGCVTCGFYATPVVVKWWSIDVEYVGAVGALLGFVGLSFAEGALRAADKFDVSAWFMRKSNGEGK